MAESAGSEFFVVGGTLNRDAACYVRRYADEELLAALRAGKFCYVLTSRQMGKSSLMVRAAVALREEGDTRVAVLDLTALGQNLTPEQWYRGLASRAGQQFGLKREVEEFWQAQADSSPLERWTRALREVVLERRPERIVIFVDEIDATRSVPFVTDEFFASIRELYNRRAEDPELSRLTFCLIGVATPSDLIQDARTTPFNVGQRVDLADFSEEEAETLLPGLGRADEKIGRILLQRILYWTGGHPYMTQRLCLAVAENRAVDSVAGVDTVCEDLFLSARARERDDNLLFVRDRILRSESDHTALLTLYDRIRQHERMRDDPAHPLISILRLSGIIRVREGYLYVRNRIYFRVFDREWVRSNLPLDEVARQKAAYRSGVIRVARIALPVCLVLLGLMIYAIHEERHAKSVANMAVNQVFDSAFVLYQQTNGDPDMQAKLEPFWNSNNVFFAQMANELGNKKRADVTQSFGRMMSGDAYVQKAKTDKSAQGKALADYLAGLKLAQAAKAQDPKSDSGYVLIYVFDDQIGLLYQEQNDDAKASAAFLESEQAARGLIRLHDNAASEDDLATAERRRSGVSDDQNQPQQALQFDQAALAAAKKAAADPQYDDDLWLAYEGLANDQDGKIADYSGALATYNDELKDVQQALAKAPDAATKTKLQSQLASTYGNRCWSELLVQKYAQALSDAKTSLQIDPTQDWMMVNLAHAYLFTGQLPLARKIYLNNPNRKLGDGDQTFAQTVLGDFKEFRGMKMVAPGMDAIEQALERAESQAAPPAPPAAAPAPTQPAK